MQNRTHRVYEQGRETLGEIQHRIFTKLSGTQKMKQSELLVGTGGKCDSPALELEPRKDAWRMNHLS